MCPFFIYFFGLGLALKMAREIKIHIQPLKDAKALLFGPHNIKSFFWDLELEDLSFWCQKISGCLVCVFKV